MSDDVRYPIGKFRRIHPVTDDQLANWIADIDGLPADMRRTCLDLTDDLLETTYRPGGWTVRQLIHHVPDSHLNAYARFKWALTEDEPSIKTYDEVAWAVLPDQRTAPVALNLDFLEFLHRKWVVLLRAMDRAQFDRTFRHPVSGVQDLATTVGSYAWHGRHHLAHIERALARASSDP